MPTWHAPEGRCNSHPSAPVMVPVQQEPAPTAVRDGMVSNVLEQLGARETAASSPADPQLVDVQAAVARRDHSSRATLRIACEARDRFADHETSAAKRITFRPPREKRPESELAYQDDDARAHHGQEHVQEETR